MTEAMITMLDGSKVTVEEARAKTAELRAKRLAAEAAADEAQAVQGEALLEELIAKYSEELGERGVAYDIIDLRDLRQGFVVLKQGAGIEHRVWQNAIERTGRKNAVPSEADMAAYSANNVVFPARDKFLAITARFTHVWDRVVAEQSKLHGVRVEDRRKNF